MIRRGGIEFQCGSKMKLPEMAILATAVLLLSAVSIAGVEVSYDGRALLINGSRRILFSGSIHYPRSTPEMWPSLIAKAKLGGLDVIQTYVFWNLHEPIPGQYNFEGRCDLVRFIKEIRDQGLYVSLRIGPFIESEWKYGGLPFWLHDIPGIVFRSNNEPFKLYMQSFVTKIVEIMKFEQLYASQGGPIILSQIENEYQNVQHAFHEKGPAYVKWAASMAVGLQTGVPWMMCKQDDAPDPVINTCNGMNCGKTFKGPNSPDKPSLWTENWTSFYQVYGEEPYIRPAKDIAYAVALFIVKKNGSFVNYYMYHGGTNFGRSTSSYIVTAYYDQAPLDEYGLIWQPKWAHLRDLHAAVKLNSEPLLKGKYTNALVGRTQEAHVFQMDTGKCVAFLVNDDSNGDATIKFRNVRYKLPPKSISILSGCRKVIFNTAMVSAQQGTRSATIVESFDQAIRWKYIMEEIPTSTWEENGLLEQMTTTKDTTDYLWYIISYNNTSGDEQYIIDVNSLSHIIHAVVNGKYAGTVHGNYKTGSITLKKTISLMNGMNDISLLSAMVGLPDSGAYLEHRVAGLRNVQISNLKNQSQDLSNSRWKYQVGLLGEKLKFFTEVGSKLPRWKTVDSFSSQPFIWYMTRFNAPPGSSPLALNLACMGKGELWINGQSIGRYWVSFKTPKGVPSQSLYHVPRSFLRPLDNLLVLFEEIGGNPSKITLEALAVTRVCGKVSEFYPKSVIEQRKHLTIDLQCHKGSIISSIEFASYGNPAGNCQAYSMGSCHSTASRAFVEKTCLGRRRCSIPVSSNKFGGDPCPGTSKSLLVVANCQKS
ncbi:Beta-galactosidase 16 [Apostasia shenzhenica]|uniref:Beta-galactosidase n=1 Tax=Apostasia shenzhenica TaxID=1088818 RepID=A0A2I0BAG7_9ASPA|nr:Beta-galactosidase 16 [Apostasia shenzhenica]